jgi:hypothetical protein
MLIFNINPFFPLYRLFFSTAVASHAANVALCMQNGIVGMYRGGKNET